MNAHCPPEIVVKFCPPSITASGVPAINAVRRPLAFAVYSWPLVAVAILVLVRGNGYVGLGLRLLKGFVGW